MYQDQYAAALNFMIRLHARQAVTVKMFMAGLAPAERARVREKAYVGFRSSNMIVENILRGDRGRGASLRTSNWRRAVRDTREVWASFFMPQDRARVIELLAGLAKQVPDETKRIDLAASRPRFKR